MRQFKYKIMNEYYNNAPLVLVQRQSHPLTLSYTRQSSHYYYHRWNIIMSFYNHPFEKFVISIAELFTL